MCPSSASFQEYPIPGKRVAVRFPNVTDDEGEAGESESNDDDDDDETYYYLPSDLLLPSSAKDTYRSELLDFIEERRPLLPAGTSAAPDKVALCGRREFVLYYGSVGAAHYRVHCCVQGIGSCRDGGEGGVARCIDARFGCGRGSGLRLRK